MFYHIRNKNFLRTKKPWGLLFSFSLATVFTPFAHRPLTADQPRGMEKFALELLDSKQVTGAIAVWDFTVAGGNPALGRLVADRMSAQLKKIGRVRVVDRKLVRETVSLHALNPGGLPDHKELKRIAPMMRARQVMLGSLTCAGKRGLINAYVIVPHNGLIASRSQMTARCR